MQAQLVDFQYAALEPLRPAEEGLTVDAAADPQAIADEAASAVWAILWLRICSALVGSPPPKPTDSFKIGTERPDSADARPARCSTALRYGQGSQRLLERDPSYGRRSPL